MMFALWSPPNDIPTKYKGPTKESNRITPALFNRHTLTSHLSTCWLESTCEWHFPKWFTLFNEPTTYTISYYKASYSKFTASNVLIHIPPPPPPPPHTHTPPSLIFTTLVSTYLQLGGPRNPRNIITSSCSFFTLHTTMSS